MTNTIIRRIINGMSDELTDSQLRKLDLVLSVELDKVDIAEKCTDLSTEVDDDIHLVNYWINSLRIAGMKNSTIEAYKFSIKHFLEYLPISVRDVNQLTIKSWLLYLRGKYSNVSTINSQIRNISAFFHFLAAEDIIVKSPFSNIQEIKEDKKEKQFLSDYDIQKVLDVCDNDRDLMLIHLIHNTGMRCKELTLLEIKRDINFEKDTILVHGKGGKERILPMNAPCKFAIIKYLNSSTRKGVVSKYLFTPAPLYARRHPDALDKPITTGQLQRDMRRLKEKSGVNICHIHAFRAHYATYLFNKGLGTAEIQYVMGHSSINTTLKNYINIDNNRLVDYARKYLA